MEPIRIALVGCGRSGQKHLQALVHLQEAVLVATVDTDRNRAEAAAVAFDAEAFASIAEMLATVTVEAAIVAVPSGLHRQVAGQLLEANLHVLVELPLALTYRDSKALVELAGERSRTLAVTQFYRLLPPIDRLLEACRTGRLGRTLEASIALRWARSQSYYDEAPWRGTRAHHGGILFNQAMHSLDLLQLVMGPADEVYAHLATLTHTIETEDTACGSIRFQSGALASLAVTTAVPKSNLEERMTVVGDQGAVVIGPTPTHLATWRVEGDDEDEILAQASAIPSRMGWQSHWDALADFIRAIRAQKPPRLAASTVLPTVALAEALTRSGLEHRPVSLQQIFQEN